MREVAVGLALQPHCHELGRHITLRSWLVQSGLSNAGHLGGHKEWQHALRGKGRLGVSSQHEGGVTLFTFTFHVTLLIDRKSVV